MGGEKLKWRQLKHNQLMSSQGPHFSPRSTAKTNDKSKNLRKNGIYCKTGNVNEQVMLTNLTSGMGSLIFLPRQQLYPINNYIPVNHYYHYINSTTTSSIQQSTISPQRDELLNWLEFWTILISLI